MSRSIGTGSHGRTSQSGSPGPDSGRETWISDEAHAVSIASRAIARARHRPGRILTIAGLAAAAFVASRLYRSPGYEAQLHFHLAEGDLTDPTHAPRPPRAVREYIFNVALSRDRVEQIMRKHGWSTGYLARDRIAAIDEFREDVAVDVSRNYFVYDRRPSDPPRTALVTVALMGSDPETTAATLHEIGEAIGEEQRAQRTGRLAKARELLQAELATARERARHLQDDIVRLQLEADRSSGRSAIQIGARIAGLQAEAKAALDQLVVLDRRATDVAFTAAAEGEDLGLRLDLVDESLVPITPQLRPLQLARRALLVFVLVALLAIPVVGAFDDRIYGPEDLEARALPLFGSVVRFPGDDSGAYRARVQARSAWR